MDEASEIPCGCERVKLVGLSPGPVHDDEELHFIVGEPGGMLGDKLHPSFLVQLDRNGLSVLRQNASIEEFERTLDELKARWEPKARKFHGIATFKTSKTRYVSDQRLCCVYDTALEGKPHHADIAGPGIKAESRGGSEKLQRQRIKLLIDNAVLRFEPATEFRNGALARFSD